MPHADLARSPYDLPADEVAEAVRWAEPALRSFSGARFFITGGTGFIGRWLVAVLACANDTLGLGTEAVVLSRDPNRAARAWPGLFGRADIQLIEGDVRTFGLPQGRFDYLIHGAAESDAALYAFDPDGMVRTIVEGARRVLDLSSKAGATRSLFLSSGAVYGRTRPGPHLVGEEEFAEADPASLSPYGRAKREAETLFSDSMGSGAAIARCFAFVGPGLPLDKHFAIGNFIRDAAAGGPIRISGDGTPLRSYQYASDLAAWLWTLAAHRGRNSKFNVGSDQSVSIAELASTVSRVCGSGSAVEIAGTPTPGAPIASYVPSVALARRELGVECRVALDEAIRRTLRWAKASTQA